jgi:hypothetical protein
MPPQLHTQGSSIVLRGDFNPSIFHPSWLASHNLIGSQEAEAAKIEIVHRDAAAFVVEWLRIEVVSDRFQAATTQESYYGPLRDLVSGVFSLLCHTPVKLMGFNRDFHYRLESEQLLHDIGHRLAPKKDWDMLQKPGMLSLTVQGARPDSLPGFILVKVEPSTMVEPGLFIEVNDHYELKSPDKNIPGTSVAAQILSEQWNQSMQRSLTIANKIASLGELK